MANGLPKMPKIAAAPKMPKGAVQRAPKAPAMRITGTPNVGAAAMRTPRIPRGPSIKP